MNGELFASLPAPNPRPTARQLAEEGMRRALEAEREAWLEKALDLLREFAAKPEYCRGFRMEEFRAWAQLKIGKPHTHHCWGAFTHMACKARVVRWTGRYVPSTSKKTHAHPVKEWVAR